MPEPFSPDAMEPTTATFFDLVRGAMPEVETRMRASPSSHHPLLVAALDQLLSAGGKRIRPTLVLLAGGMLGGDSDRMMTMAAAIELLHTATLVHDDLIDGALLRRGVPTLNATWTAGATVLTGDYVFARAAYLTSQSGSLPLMEIFARTLMTIVHGEITQLFGSAGQDSKQEYLDRIYSKTASLFELATEGAAIISGSDPETTRKMRTLGYHFGMAFQIVDDVLDFVADPDRIGKPVAHDLRQGLLTLPTLLYLEVHPKDTTVRSLVQREAVDETRLTSLIEAIRASGSIERSMEQAREFAGKGETMLADMPAKPERDALYELAAFLIERAT